MSARPLRFGEPAPHLTLRTNRNPRFAFDAMGGRYVLLWVAASDPPLKLLEAAHNHRSEDTHVAALVWRGAGPPEGAPPSLLVALDEDGAVFAAWGGPALFPNGADGGWILLDPSLRVLGLWALAEGEAALAAFCAAPPPAPSPAPVLAVPRVFERAFCAQLIAHYDARGGEASGTTKEDEAGRTFVSLDDSFKRRSDCVIEDQALKDACMHRLYWRLRPEIKKAFCFDATRMERYIVTRYDSAEGGFFRPHRDNTTKGTAHRRFAVTINLNAEDYEGGDLNFPEYGPQLYRAPTGGAIVFSCSLLHEARPVTKGTRYAFLPFLYDESAAAERERNSAFVDPSIPAYTRS